MRIGDNFKNRMRSVLKTGGSEHKSAATRDGTQERRSFNPLPPKQQRQMESASGAVSLASSMLPRNAVLLSPAIANVESRLQAEQRMDEASQAALKRCVSQLAKVCESDPRAGGFTSCGDAARLIADSLGVSGAPSYNDRPRLRNTDQLIDELEKHGVRNGEERTLFTCYIGHLHTFAIACVGSRAVVLQAYVGTYSLPDWLVGSQSLSETPLSPKRGLLPVKKLASLLREMEQSVQTTSPQEAADSLMGLFCAPESLRDQWTSMVSELRERKTHGTVLEWHSDAIAEHIDYEHLRTPEVVRAIDDWEFRPRDSALTA